ncbi:hypothetical protein [Nostoc sp.]|uniref:hypothetical protein n=1 Tax=Nostoc sp. TaxID=1180 RepID=UPI002FFCE90D
MCITVNGIRYFQWNAIAIPNDKREVVEIQQVGRDITEQQAALHDRQLTEAAYAKVKRNFALFPKIPTQ